MENNTVVRVYGSIRLCGLEYVISKVQFSLILVNHRKEASYIMWIDALKIFVKLKDKKCNVCKRRAAFIRSWNSINFTLRIVQK